MVQVQRVIPLLVYDDIPSRHDFLVNVIVRVTGQPRPVNGTRGFYLAFDPETL